MLWCRYGTGPMHNHKLIGHTADIRAGLCSESMAGLLVSAYDAVLEIYGLSPAGEGSAVREISVNAQDNEELLVEFINSLLYLVQTEKFWPRAVDKTEVSGFNARVVLSGKNRENGVPISREIKAATFHGLVVKNDGKNFTAEVFFDL